MFDLNLNQTLHLENLNLGTDAFIVSYLKLNYFNFWSDVISIKVWGPVKNIKMSSIPDLSILLDSVLMNNGSEILESHKNFCALLILKLIFKDAKTKFCNSNYKFGNKQIKLSNFY